MGDYGNDFVVLTDEDGKEEEFEHLDTLELDGQTYMAFVPAQMSLQDEADLVILKLTNEGTDEEVLATVDDDEELQSVFGLFLERLDNDELYDDEEDEEDEDYTEDGDEDYD